MENPLILPEGVRAWLARRPGLWVAGGAVRDALLGVPLRDLDLAVPRGARALAAEAAEALGGRLVVLHEEEGVFRVALEGGFFLDFSDFRQGSRRIEEDLRLRDFTVNALAVPAEEFLSRPPGAWRVLDPTGGLADLKGRLLRAISRENLEQDPLRLLRGYRLAASLGFSLEAGTRRLVASLSDRLHRVARERVGAEVRLLFEHAAGEVVSLMAEDGLLFAVFPELAEARGVPQPSFHHLDVLGHLLLALERADRLLADPTPFFGQAEDDPFRDVQRSREAAAAVRLAALFHDVGKPRTFAVRHRITFYEHDRVGAEMVLAAGERLRFSRRFTQKVALLVRHHMRPFHLLNERLRGRLTRRAMRRLLKDCEDYVSLFLVAMADSLASAGPDKQGDLEAQLAALFWEMHRFRQEVLVPQEKARLVTGRDLIELFGLEPGPVFRELLEEVEEARAEGLVRTREEALAYLGELVSRLS